MLEYGFAPTPLLLEGPGCDYFRLPTSSPHRTLSIASLIAEAIGRTASEESVSSLFD